MIKKGIILVSFIVAMAFFISGCAQIQSNQDTQNNQTDVEDEQNETQQFCTTQYEPVCGVDGQTYSNSCVAGDVEIAYEGRCNADNALPPPPQN